MILKDVENIVFSYQDLRSSKEKKKSEKGEEAMEDTNNSTHTLRAYSVPDIAQSMEKTLGS